MEDTGMFTGLMGGKESNAIDVLNKLLEKEDIELKTDLNIKQIKVLVQLKLLSMLDEINDDGTDKYTPEYCVEEAVKYYLYLMVSLGRKSRIEISESVKELKEAMQQQNLLQAGMTKK